MALSDLFRKTLHVLVLLSLMLGPAQPWPAHPAAAARPDTLAAPAVSAAAGNPSAAGLPLYRTRITLRNPADRARLEKLGVVVLEATADDPTADGRPPTAAHGSTADGRPPTAAGDDSAVGGPWSAVVLADAEQLEALARLGFRPTATDDADALIAHHAAAQPALAAAWGEIRQRMEQRMETDKRMTSAALVSLSTSPLSTTFVSLSSLDDDADGLTNTEEAWWCTDPLNPDSDGDGVSDGDEVAALKAWLANKLPGPPASGKPFAGWPPLTTSAGYPGRTFACQDDDRDSVPDLAERWELGLNMNRESSDRDKFDDGQELFGSTNCPGGDASCGYGDLPRSSDSGYVGAVMPSWVKAPGNHPLVAAFPEPEVDVVPSSLHVETVTTVTTDHTISSGTERSYSTAKTEGTSSSVSDTEMWNEWQEISLSTPVYPLSSRTRPGRLSVQTESNDQVLT